MTPPAPHSRINPLLAEGVLAISQMAFLVSTRLYQPGVLLDDAFIHFKYALSWGRGDGWVFNAGEHVLGTTSPVWAFLLGTVHWVSGIEIPTVATGLNFVFDAAATLLIVHLLRRAGVGLVMRHAIALAANAEPLRILNSVGGMEMSLFTLVVLAAIEGLRGGRWWFAAAALAPAGFIRPEGAVLWIACAAAILITRQWKLGAKTFAAAIPAAILIAVLIISAYGTFIPHSLHAKRLAPWYLSHGGLCPTQFFVVLANLVPLNAIHGFKASWGTPMDRINSSVIAVSQILLMILGAHWMWKSGMKAPGAVAGLFAAGYYLFYAVTNPAIFPWYYVPYLALGILLGGLGAWHGLAWIATKTALFQKAGVWKGVVQSAGGALWLAMMLITLANREAGGVLAGETAIEALDFRLAGSGTGDREVDYIRIADRMNAWLRHNPRASVGCMEIGIFGYYFRGHVLDSYGLVSPEALAVVKPEVEWTLPESCRRHPVNVFMVCRPEFIMTAGFMLLNPPPEFYKAYQQLVFPDSTLKVFVRRDAMDEPWGFPREHLANARRRDGFGGSQ